MAKEINRDLTGKIFERLTVLSRAPSVNGRKMWNCKCECGNTKTIREDSLISGKTRSCGCLHKEINSKSKTDLTGMQFERLTVIKEDDNWNGKGNKWICKCNCDGKLISVLGRSLLEGHTRSCGCLLDESRRRLKPEMVENLEGNRYGRLCVIKYSHRSESGEYIFKCLCDCGNITYVSNTNLKSGHIKSCGCLNSKGEDKIERLLQENDIVYKKQITFNDLENENGNKLKFDFGIYDNFDNLQYLIEFDGVHHYQSRTSGWNTDENLMKTRESDERKNNYCIKHNIPLIRIPYYEYQNIDIAMLTLDEGSNKCIVVM